MQIFTNITSLIAAVGAVVGHDVIDEQAGLSEYQTDMLNYHNVHRWNHTSESLSWSPKLEAAAKRTAHICKLKHDRAGQNLAGAMRRDDVGPTVSNMWYNNEFSNYDRSPNAASEPTKPGKVSGHFTQVVWSGSERLGCYTADCRKTPFGFFLTVCNYEPVGNVRGQYKKNVHKAIGYPVLRP
ncbi:PR-1-like protein [Pseudovirgaria hyperparasitica]|uniref:PR-1-like protein n=1 Tax=Pseudovirgaria hyperparasitica TaxID=470096 RepID=A0A6A6WKE7_9PEZI|nr:PR-1-like protein [Pseudovirgaria hyperparasitica]KAF2762632.1 PR-1-like protein [Pseudovirgaria hyperparasitica]